MSFLLKSWNPLVNTALFPGSFAPSNYDIDSIEEETEGSAKLIFIPTTFSVVGVCCGLPSYIPAILIEAENNVAGLFCIYFHANACDIASIMHNAVIESRAHGAHYLLVEYPRYGISAGLPSESAINCIAKDVLKCVEETLLVDPSRIVLLGRSIGTGPTCFLASYMESQSKRPAAVILHSPYSSIRNVSLDLLGQTISTGLLDRWQSWKVLCGDVSDSGGAIVKAPVLFIHADNDCIIFPTHSTRMHAARVAASLPSSLFIQQSSPTYIKGHNYYQFKEDYLRPCKRFLKSYVAAPEVQIILLQETIEQLMAIPPFYKPAPAVPKPDLERVANNSEESEEEQVEKKNLYNPLFICSLLSCPITTCGECFFGCLYSSYVHSIIYIGGHDLYSPFQPENRRPQEDDINRGDNLLTRIVKSLWHNGSVQFDIEDEESLRASAAATATSVSPMHLLGSSEGKGRVRDRIRREEFVREEDGQGIELSPPISSSAPLSQSTRGDMMHVEREREREGEGDDVDVRVMEDDREQQVFSPFRSIQEKESAPGGTSKSPSPLHSITFRMMPDV